jgi:hypothetical protein
LDDVHTLSSECSGVGTCNTRTGKCVCNAGFSGDACQTLACPTAGNLVCGGKGKCMSLAAAAAAGYSAVSASLPRPASQYRAWDAERVFGCVCDEGWSGPDCTVQLCPQGPDPLATALPEVQSVTCTCGEGGDCSSGGFSVSYGPRTALVLAAARATTAEEDPTAPQGSGYALGESVESVLRSVAPGMISTVVLTGGAASACGPSPGATLVTFLPSLGNVPPLLLGQGTLPHPDSVQLTLSTFQDGTAEVLPCSGRGKCTGGACTCLPGFYPSDGAGGPGAVANCGSLYPPPALGLARTNITKCQGSPACSNRGWCDTSRGAFICRCAAGWHGPACDLKSCPLGRAWWDQPSPGGTAHALAPCSNRGRCNVDGSCTCLSGFTGESSPPRFFLLSLSLSLSLSFLLPSSHQCPAPEYSPFPPPTLPSLPPSPTTIKK